MLFEKSHRSGTLRFVCMVQPQKSMFWSDVFMELIENEIIPNQIGVIFENLAVTEGCTPH